MTRIMIVEDNKHARHALKALLSQQAEMKVISEASNGQEAIQNIKEQLPDVILMDMQMPVMGGLEATKIIKAKWSQIRIIALTMYPEYQTDAMKAGADTFLLKGCGVEELASVIRNFQNPKTGGSLSIFGFFPALIPPHTI